MKRSNLILLCIAVLALLAFVPKAEEPIERLVSSLQKWVDKNPQEKVYLHMDKPYYALGDTVWFKAYVTIGSRHQLSKMSGALYVELIDEKDSLLSSLKLPLTAGMALGDFTLGDEYRAGNFRIRAYTQWMRNAGEEYFFDKSFVVADPLGPDAAYGLKSKDKTVGGLAVTDHKGAASPLSASDVQFFPEGGSLVNGINSRMGFKVLAASGRGIGVKGVVTDNAGIEVSNFETLHAGMGVFNFRPEAGKTYKAKVTFSDGSEKTLDLPKALEQGYVLSVYQPGPDSVLVRINASPAQYQIPYAVDLMVHSGGETVSASTVKINKAVNSVWLMKKDFPSGIAQFTLFDGRGEAINERIAFIRAKDQMQLVLNSTKKSYKSRERVELEMEARDKSGKPVAGNFSVSVIDESKVPNDENAETTIFSSMLLSSDIKGYIEEPNYYFRKDTAEVNKALDNLMLTQGYRRFVWKDILSTTTAGSTSRYPAESLGTEISGRVLTLSGKPVVNGQVTVMSLTPGFMEQAKTDADGRFKYLPIMLADSLRFAVQARTDKNSNKVEVLLDSIPRQVIGKNWNIPGFTTNIEESTKTYLENSRKQDDLLGRTGGQSRVNRLKEVQITAKRRESAQYVSQGGYTIPDGHADQTFKMRNGETCSNLGTCLNGRLQGVTFLPLDMVPLYPYARDPRSQSFERLPMQVIVNGRRIDPQEADDIFNNNVLDPADVLKVEVVINNNALVAMLGKPTILIYTNRSYARNKRYNPAIANIRPKGFNKAREFYAPRYDRPNISQQLPDLRSTIYWNPKLKTDSLGKGSFSFFNADGPGNYKVVVEGINAAGELARQVYHYEVGGEGRQVSLPELPSGKTAELVKAIQGYQQRLPAEKLYIHTDKPYYNIGDTLWFKAYLFDAATLAASKRSGFLYIELNDDTAEAVRRISVPVKNGIAYAQIPLPRKIFHEGGYTMRAYTNWMQNFGEDYFFTQRFYLGVPTWDTWLVQSSSKLSRVLEKDQLEVNIDLIRPDRTVVSLRDVEVKLMEGSNQLSKPQKLQTGSDGKLKLKYELKEKADGRNIRLEVVSLHPNDGGQRLKIPLNVKRNQLIDLQFLPEGGNLVAGLKSIIGFKALAEDGKGADVSGEIYDSKGNVVKTFSSLYKGMGSFEFTPLAGERYTAKLLQPEATGKSYVFPVVKSEGTVLHVLNDEKAASLSIDIAATPNAIVKDSVYYLVGTSRGMVTYSKEITAGQKSVSIAKELFPAGITRFTLLRGKTPLNERIVFIDHKDNLRFSFKTNKAIYGKRENIGLSMTVTDKNGTPVKGRFSLAVTDDNQVKADSVGNLGMTAKLLLSSELKGSLETPGYYLSASVPERWQALDNLMLTQGWTGYSWEDVFAAPKPPKYEAEQHFKVSGTVTNILNKPVAGAQMLITSQKPFFISTGITDEKGNYVFENLPQIDSGSFFIQAKTPKGRSMNFGAVTVDRFKSAIVPFNFRDQQLPWYVNSELTQLNYLKNVVAKAKESSLKQSGIALKEVKIVSKKIIKDSYARYGPGNADLIFDAEDIKESGTAHLYQFLKQKLPGLRVVHDEGLPALLLNERLATIIIDGGGLPLDVEATDVPSTDDLIDAINAYTVANLVGVEVLYSKKYMPRYFGSVLEEGYIPPFRAENYLDVRVMTPNRKLRDHAVIELTTLNKRGWHINRRPDYATFRPLPVMHPQEFYSPKYTAQAKDAAEPDFRSTLYWAPDILTDQNGKAELSFYSSDIPESYSINVQGSDMDGNIGGTHLRFNTKGKQVMSEQTIVMPKMTPTELPTGESAEIVKAVAGLQQRKPAEKLYLHTDRSYYNLGDTLWFKAYLLDALSLSASKRSGLLYVELNDDSAETVRRISIPIKNGEGWAQIPLTAKIFHGGGYTLRAYTNWMQNFGEDHFFSRRFYLGTPGQKSGLTANSIKLNEPGQLDLQFLPEGGHLVAGLSTVVGFKALGEDGKGVQVSGLVRDSKGIVVVDFKSFHQGMGSFVLKPQPAERYTAEVKLPDGQIKTFALPATAAQGTVLNVVNQKDNELLEIRLAATEMAKQTDSAWYLIGTSRGAVNYIKTIDFSQGIYEVPKSLFFTGIARFTLLKGSTPVNERITFIDREDQLAATLKTQKTAYAKRDSVSLEIEVKDQYGKPLKGSFSVAVTDDSQIRADSTGNADIATGLLISADLKGTVENPGYYLNHKTKQSWQALDHLMLTQGWAGYSWKEVFDAAQPLKYEAEQYLKVSGTVTDILKKPVKGTQVLLSSQKPAFITTGLSDENGRYVFENLPAIDSGAFFIQAKDPKGKTMNFGAITVNKFIPAPVTTSYLGQALSRDVNTDLSRFDEVAQVSDRGNLQMDGISLKEVAIKGRKKIPGSWNPNGAGNADIVLDEKDIKESGTMTLYDLLKQKIPGLRVVSDDGFPTLKMNNYLVDINIDGQELPLRLNSGPTVEELKAELIDFKIVSFTGLEVMYSRKYTNRFYQFNKPNNRTETAALNDPRFDLMSGGSSTYLAQRVRLPTPRPVEIAKIVITTKHQKGWYKISKADVTSYRPVPFMQAKEFYSPKYKDASATAGLADYRPTIFWKPNVTTNSAGKAMVSFYTSDQPGSYSVNLQGADMDGIIGSSKTQLKVGL
ncbi:MAG: hypothetical protein V4594_00530 [Bacteroidota bacterium]